MDGRRGDRRGGAGPGPLRGPLRAVLLSRAGGLRRPAAVGDAVRVRRPPGEAGSKVTPPARGALNARATGRRSGVLWGDRRPEPERNIECAQAIANRYRLGVDLADRLPALDDGDPLDAKIALAFLVANAEYTPTRA